MSLCLNFKQITSSAFPLRKVPKKSTFGAFSDQSGRCSSNLSSYYSSHNSVQNQSLSSRKSILSHSYCSSTIKNETSNANAESSQATPPPNVIHQTVSPKSPDVSIKVQKLPSQMGTVEIGKDGQIISAASGDASKPITGNTFTSRKSVTSQEALVRRMYDIDKTLKSKKTQKIVEAHKSSPGFSASTLLPETVIYDYKPSRWVGLLNGVSCLATFPLHIWGFMTLPAPHLVLPFFSGSLLWLWWHHRTMNSTATKITLQPGHTKVTIQSQSFFGLPKERTVQVTSLTSGVERASPDSIKQVSYKESQESLGTSTATLEVRYLEVLESMANVEDQNEIQRLKDSAHLTKRTRYVLEPTKATTLNLPYFLRFTNTPAVNVSLSLKQLF